MPTRRTVTGLIVGGALLSSAVGTSAFQQSSADRDLSVSVAADDSEDVNLRFVSLDGRYAEITNEDVLKLEFGELFGPSGGEGLNTNAVVEFDQVFGIKNQSLNDDIELYSEQVRDSQDPEVELYDSFSESKSAFTSGNPAEIPTGRELVVGVRIDTSNVPVQSDPYELTLQLVAVDPS